ncbi:hypothetical protein BT69DRAFT_1284939 [Atractiella rhizophila]|nr:hypothetical protein BT69DRAFT_1284939 [Atractiella rhizophila]
MDRSPFQIGCYDGSECPSGETVALSTISFLPKVFEGFKGEFHQGASLEPGYCRNAETV